MALFFYPFGEKGGESDWRNLRRINEADFVCTIIWYRTQYMNYIILGIAEFMLVGVLAAGAFVLALESEVRNWQC
ncbi:hypothetical protein DW846_12360 [Ruminococcus sp. AM36-2AA]|nr:hypothetical protein DW851_12375 [Ruminococcus sp. AM36-5]RGH56233.1 hypothetical protein DW846_12360 [Ruminococcus sp. AM36-2AA]